MRPAHIAILVLVWVFTGCAAGPKATPTLSPEEIATRLAQIPTAAINPTLAAPRGATVNTATAVPPTPEVAEPAATATPQPPTRDNSGEYVVRPGDTLSSIAYAFNISMASIQIANNLGASQNIQAGQKLVIPAQKRFPDENVFWFVAVVDAGDTLSGISAKYGVSMDDLIRVNQLRDASAIRIGQDLIVPVSAPAPAPAPAPSTGGPINTDESAQVAVPDEQAAPAIEVPIAPPPPAAPEIVELAPLAPPAEPVEAAAKDPAPMMRAAASANGNSDSVNNGQQDNGQIEGMRQTLLALYNQARSDGGEAPLAASFVLQNAAQWHAEDCAQRGFGSHTGSDGLGTRARIQRAGYSGNIAGENWAWARSAEQAFNMWFHQEAPTGPHRANIMSSRYTEVGFGIVPANGGYYFIADFGAP